MSCFAKPVKVWDEELSNYIDMKGIWLQSNCVTMEDKEKCAKLYRESRHIPLFVRPRGEEFVLISEYVGRKTIGFALTDCKRGEDTDESRFDKCVRKILSFGNHVQLGCEASHKQFMKTCSNDPNKIAPAKIISFEGIAATRKSTIVGQHGGKSNDVVKYFSSTANISLDGDHVLWVVYRMFLSKCTNEKSLIVDRDIISIPIYKAVHVLMKICLYQDLHKRLMTEGDLDKRREFVFGFIHSLLDGTPFLDILYKEVEKCNELFKHLKIDVTRVVSLDPLDATSYIEQYLTRVKQTNEKFERGRVSVQEKDVFNYYADTPATLWLYMYIQSFTFQVVCKKFEWTCFRPDTTDPSYGWKKYINELYI